MKTLLSKTLIFGTAAVLLSACDTASLSLDSLNLSTTASPETTLAANNTEPAFTLCQLCVVTPEGLVAQESNPNLRGVVENVVQQPDALIIEGWAADIQSGSPAQTVLVFAGATLVGQTQTGLPRPSLAQSYGLSAMEESGFQLTLPTSLLAEGQVELRVYALDADNAAIALSLAGQ